MHEKMTLKLSLAEHPVKSCIFNLLDVKGKLRPEIVALLEEGIAKYYGACGGTSYVEVEDQNEHLTLKVSAQIER